MVGLLQDNLLEKDPGHDGMGWDGMGGQGKESENEGRVLGDRKRCSGVRMKDGC